MRIFFRLIVIWLVVMVWGTSDDAAYAAVAQRVQSGTTASTANGVTTVTISSVDPARSVLFFSSRHDGNRPVNSQIRGRLASATSIEFERVTNEAPVVTMDIQWYVVTFGTGVNVQRGEVDLTATTVNVGITAVASLGQAFVLWSKTPNATDATWGSDDPVVGELTTTSNLQFRTNQAAGHRVAWQVVEFTNAADINVQKGTTSLTGGALSTAVTLGTAVDVDKTFVLAGFTTAGTGNNVGPKILRARLTDATTVTLDRAVAGTNQDMPDIVWQAIELKDDSSVFHGTANFPTGTAQAVVTLPTVNPTRAVAFGSVQGGSGQNMGSSPYVADDVPGVATATAALTASQLTLDRNNTADSADVGWFVVQFAGGSGFKVGSFAKAVGAAPTTQTIAHGLGEVPKALILWTAARTDESFGRGAGAITFRSAASAGSASGVLTLAVNKPANTAANDVMVASIAFRPNTAAITAPADWTLVRRVDNASATQNSIAVYVKVAGAGEPASYTWTFNTSTGSAGGILAFSGVDITNPINVENGQTTPNALTHAAPSVTTTATNTMVVTTHAFSSGATWTPPAGMTEAVDVWSQNNPCCAESLEVNFVAQAAAGATGTKTATASNDSDVGVTHTLALNPGGGAYLAFGMTDGTTSRSVTMASQNQSATSAASRRIASKALTLVRWGQVVLAEADLQSWDGTNFTLNWTTNDGNPYVIHYVAIGGSDVSAKVVGWTMGTATGNRSVTGVGFQPNVVLHAHAGFDFTAAPSASATHGGFGLGAMDTDGDQWAYSLDTRSGSANADTQRGQQTDACLFAFNQALAVQKKASWVSMDADGFTVNFTNAASAAASQVVSLALQGVNVKPGSFLKATGGAPAGQAVTGVGFQPGLVVLTSVQDVTQANPVAESRLGLGASDGASSASSALFDTDASANMNADTIDKTSKVFVKVNNATPAIDAQADFTSLDPDGFTLNWTSNDAVATEILYLAMAPLAKTEVRLLSFAATRYPSGVLLAWRTGYEIDNLGFHLYREVGGARVRVTRAMVAGSGLMAGRGKAVTVPQSYALWDLNAGAQDADAQYWLEDVDFAGVSTWHGPIVPVRGGLVAPDVTTSAAIDELARWRRGGRRFFVDQGGVLRGVGGSGPPSAMAVQWALAAQPAIKIGVNTPGWYRVGQPELVAAGLDPRTDPRRLQLYLAGVEQAIVVSGEADGRFDPEDGVEFYGTGTDTPSTSTRVYWLAAGARPGQRVPRIGATTRRPDTAGSFWFTRQQKERSIYFAALRNGEAENWFGSLVSEMPTDFVVSVSNVDPAASGPAELEVALQGVTIGSARPDHQVAISVNGTEVGTLVFDGQDRGVTTVTVPHGLLREGDNTVTLVALGGETDLSLFDVLRLSYWHTYRADADLVRVTAEGPGAVTIGGFAARPIRVIDITDPAAAIELGGRDMDDENGLASVGVRVPGAGPRTLLAFTPATVATPAFVHANRPSAWHAPRQAVDYVAIADAAFAAASQPLVDLRRHQGLAAELVDVEDLYDEFNFGEKAPDAIKDFLLYAHATWQRSPRFVVLVGDATIDPRDYAGFGNADFVPTRSVPMNSVALETASDEWFADFDEDGLPELAVGRLPVRTPEQAAAVVSKIVRYDEEPAGAWAKQVTLVADEDDDLTSFQATSARLASQLPDGYTGHELDRRRLGPDAIRDQLFSLAGQGQLLVNYLGHGSTRVWGRSGDLLSNEDIATSWTVDGARLPVVVAMNCLNGFFHGTYDEESLAEALIRAPAGGAVAVWASSSLTPMATQGLVNEALFRLIFEGTYATLGESVAAAKQAVNNRDLRRSWILFGDPALRLKGVPQPAAGGPGPGSEPPPGSQPGLPEPSDPGSGAPAAGAPYGAAATTGARLIDFDGDRRDDVFLYSATTGFWTIRSSRARGRVASGTWPRNMRAFPAYLNDDRLGDVLLYDRETGDWLQAIGGGDGRFTIQPNAWAPGWRVHVADVDGSRRDDVVLHDAQLGTIFLCTTDEAGGFACRAGGSLPPGELYVADFTGDRRADLFVYDATTGNWATGVNDGTGTFGYTTGTWSPGWTVSVGDVGGDRRSDLVLFHPDAGAWVVSFTAEPAALALPPGRWAPGGQTLIVDLDGDGDGDLFRHDPRTGAWKCALQVEPGRFEVRAGGAWSAGATVAFGDLNGDAREDVLLVDPSTGAWLSLLGKKDLGLVPGEVGSFDLAAGIVGAVPDAPEAARVAAPTPVAVPPPPGSPAAGALTRGDRKH